MAAGAEPAATAKEHWDRIYATRDPDSVSWYQQVPEVSLALIEATGAGTEDAILDIGGGASGLAGHLLDRGFTDVTVLDIADAGMAHARRRLGPRAGAVEWIAADVTAWRPARAYAVWHDRAVFHFLVEEAARRAYRTVLHRAVTSGGSVVLAAFAPDGPERCSGLPVQRHSAESLAAELGPEFALEETRREEHHTPAGGAQRFLWARFRRAP